MRVAGLLAAACGLAAAQDAREMVRRAVQRMDHDLAVAATCAFLERTASRELDGDGRVKSHRILLYDVTPMEGSPYRRLAGRDGHPLSPEEERAEQSKMQESLEQRRRETPAQRARRIAEWERRRQRQREPLDEAPEAFDFRITGVERAGGRDAWVMEATPRPGYHARGSLARLFPKFRGKLWIDKEDGQLVRTEAEAVADVWWGLFIARLSKGARLAIEMTRVNAGLWAPKRIEADGSARIALVKKIRIERETTYSNYRYVLHEVTAGR